MHLFIITQCVCVCVCACVPACMRACLRACVRTVISKVYTYISISVQFGIVCCISSFLFILLFAICILSLLAHTCIKKL